MKSLRTILLAALALTATTTGCREAYEPTGREKCNIACVMDWGECTNHDIRSGCAHKQMDCFERCEK